MLLRIENVGDISARLPNVVRLGAPKTKSITREGDEILLVFDRPGFVTYAIGQSMNAYFRGNPYLLENGVEQVIPEDGTVYVNVGSVGVGAFTLFMSAVDVDGENRGPVYEYDFENTEEFGEQ